MFLVEFTQIFKNEVKKRCHCYYHRSEAMIFAHDLLKCNNIKSISISGINACFAHKICDLRDINVG